MRFPFAAWVLVAVEASLLSGCTFGPPDWRHIANPATTPPPPGTMQYPNPILARAPRPRYSVGATDRYRRRRLSHRMRRAGQAGRQHSDRGADRVTPTSQRDIPGTVAARQRGSLQSPRKHAAIDPPPRRARQDPHRERMSTLPSTRNWRTCSDRRWRTQGRQPSARRTAPTKSSTSWMTQGILANRLLSKTGSPKGATQCKSKSSWPRSASDSASRRNRHRI